MRPRPAPAEARLIAEGIGATNVVWYGVGQLVPAAIMLLTVPWWVRLVGIVEYGGYSIQWAVATAGSAAGVGWLRQALLRETGASSGSIALVPTVAVCGCVMVPALACVGAGLLWGGGGLALLVSAVFGVSVALVALLASTLQQQFLARTQAVLEVGRVLVAVGLVAPMIAVAGARGTTLLLCLATANLILAGVVATRHRIRLLGGRTRDTLVLRTWWSYGWPLGVWTALAPLVLYCDRLFLAGSVDAGVVGRYAAVSDVVVRGTAALATPLLLAAHPTVMRLVNEGAMDGAARILRRWALRLAALVTALAVCAAAFGPGAATVLTGGAGTDRWTIVGLTVAAGAWQLALLAHKNLEIQRRTRAMLATLTTFFGLELICLWLLVPEGGTRAAAWSVALAGVGYAVTSAALGRRGRLQ